MRKSLIFLIIFCISLISVNGVRYVNYNLYEGIILYNGSFSMTSHTINNVKAIGFTCLDQNCNNLGDTIFNPSVMDSSNNTFLQLNYPTTLLSQYGYAVYYFKDGFIPWESNPNWWGTNPLDPQGPINVYLSKKEVCRSFINNVSIVNSGKEFMPLAINVNTGISGDLLSSINPSGPLNAIPTEVASYYKVKQEIKLKILDEENNLVYEDLKNSNLMFGENKSFSFTYTPIKHGKYNFILSSKVNDKKCLSNPEVNVVKEATVFSQEEPVNICYTLINNIELNSYSFKAGDTILIKGKKISNIFKKA